MAGFCFTDKSRILDSAAAKSNAKESAANNNAPEADLQEYRSRCQDPESFRPR